MAEKAVKLNKTATATKEAAPKPLVKASARSLHFAPRKMRLVTNLVKNMRVADALTQLRFTNKKGAKMVSKLLMSAAANAENNFSLNRDNLFIKSITCDMGQVLQRSFPRARGSAFIIRRKLCHVNVVLEERPGKTKKSKAVMPKAEKKEKPVKANIPEGVASEIPQADVKETHHEHDAEVVEDKKSPEQLKK